MHPQLSGHVRPHLLVEPLRTAAFCLDSVVRSLTLASTMRLSLPRGWNGPNLARERKKLFKKVGDLPPQHVRKHIPQTHQQHTVVPLH